MAIIEIFFAVRALRACSAAEEADVVAAEAAVSAAEAWRSAVASISRAILFCSSVLFNSRSSSLRRNHSLTRGCLLLP